MSQPVTPETPATDSSVSPPRGWWYGIGKAPSSAEVEFAARHYDLVVLNAWETAAQRRLRVLNPSIKVLVYKDFSSTRNYPGTVDGGTDAALLPTGVGYVASHRDWFAVDTEGRRIEWEGYPRHWQMAVWHPAYQRAWASAVTAEVLRNGWDGVLADNDVNTLRWYSPAVIAGTADSAATDRLLRDGLDGLLTAAGESLRRAGKLLIPNLSESRLRPGRWTAHSRFGGALEEIFALRQDTTGILTFQGDQWPELRAQAALGESWLLLMTHASDDRAQRVGYATAALLAGPRTLWSMSSTGNYTRADWSRYQDAALGHVTGPARQQTSGVWTRSFTNGWVAVNPTTVTKRVTPPQAMVTVDGATPSSPAEINAGDAMLLVRRR